MPRHRPARVGALVRTFAGALVGALGCGPAAPAPAADSLRAEHAALRAEVAALREANAALRRDVVALWAEVAARPRDPSPRDPSPSTGAGPPPP